MYAFALTLALLNQSGSSIDSNLARRYFQEAQWYSNDDRGQLWGKELYGPMIFVDPIRRDFVSNEAPPVEFESKGEVFTGKLPDRIGIANYALNWGGKRWTMVMWPLPTNRSERGTLMMHELFHRIQPELGHPMSSPANDHLESLDGRLWLQVEFAALSRALGAIESGPREEAARDALRFRLWRQSKFPDAKTSEDALDLNEGLAQFTGYMLRGGWEPESRIWLANQLRQQLGRANYTRSFAYWTGSAYAYLLNVVESSKFEGIRWRKGLRPDASLAGLLGDHLGIKQAPSEAEALAAAKPYGHDQILVVEQNKAKERAEREAEIRKRFLQSAVLILPLDKVNISFNPNGVMSLGSEGLYYPTATVIEAWGKLEVSEGLLLAADRKTARVAPPANFEDRKGPGWTITLDEGWRIVKDERTGNFHVVQLR
ncbi:MAG TPA: hypothetical protein PLX06_09645 [Fimbriimonadaceae bacterium]|nr:hypothetical protein [Fimbriimonadaceae bacterium]